MILKKPYAFFIKIFKPMHIFMAILTSYLIYISNNILGFFNEYIHSSENVVGQAIKQNLVTDAIYIIPIIIIIFSLIFLGIMFSKKKPITFYVVNIFMYLIILIISVYTASFLISMEKAVISIKIVKLIHDLNLINMIIEIISFIFMIIRGLGLNFKKFNFDSDISKLNISEFDKEEIELNINVDLESAKRKRKRNLRHFKYLYKENKFIINVFFASVLIFITIFSLYLYLSSGEKNIEGVIYSTNKFNLKIDKSMFINQSFKNQKITENHLVVVDVSLQTNLENISLDLKNFALEIEDAVFYSQRKFAKSLADIGNFYDQNELTSEYTNYIFIFEIPEKYMASDLKFVYQDEGIKTKINLEPQNYVSNKITQSVNIQDVLNFKDSIGEISFKVNEFEIRDKFLIQYNYCVQKGDCLLSKEYIKASINENFDKYVLKLNVDYHNNSHLNIISFYDFFSKFGAIKYKIDGVQYVQDSNFEHITSKKISNKSNVYIGVNSNIASADSINLVFTIRDSEYTYLLKKVTNE